MTPVPDHHPFALASLLDPLDEPTFLREYWGRKPAVLRSRDPGRFDGLFDLNDLEEYLFIARPAAGELQVIRKGEWAPVRQVAGLFPGGVYDVQAVHSALADGFTIVLNAVHTRWPAVRRFVDSFEDGLLARAQTNVYVTGPRGQGFAVHTDSHDVFVLQTCGTKRWRIYDRPSQPAASASPEPLFDLEVGRGDVLYLPIGYPHAAETSADVSIHLSLGVFPLTRQALAHDCLNAVAARDPSWSEPLPLAQIRGDDAASASDLADRLRDGLTSLGDLAPMFEQYRRGLAASARRKNPPPSGYAESLRALDDLSVEAAIERRPGVGCFVTTGGGRVAIHFMGETILAPMRAEHALRFVASTPRFIVGEIDETLSESSKLVLVRRLVREGLLQLAAPRASQ